MYVFGDEKDLNEKYKIED